MGSRTRNKYTKLVLLLLLEYVLSTRTINSQPAAGSSASPATAVLDIDGHEIQTGSKYIILTIFQNANNRGGGGGGGLALAPKDRPCPLYVTEEENLQGSNGGLPVKFIPADAKQQIVSLSSDVNVMFYIATICVQSTAWKLETADKITGRRYVMTGGATGWLGSDTTSSWFRVVVEKQGGSGNNSSVYYKMVFCSGVCSGCKVVCGSVGVFNESGKRWLGLTDEPLALRFKKV